MKGALHVVVLEVRVDAHLAENVHDSRKAKERGNVQDAFAVCVDYVQIGSAFAQLSNSVNVIESAG